MSEEKRRLTLTGREIRKHIDTQVKVFLENGIALDGVLLDYFYDPVERDGVITLTSNKGDPALVFRRYVTTVQPIEKRSR
jgi:sRNA-binding regulator protein Hfq